MDNKQIAPPRMKNQANYIAYQRQIKIPKIVQKPLLSVDQALKVDSWHVGKNELLSNFGHFFVLFEKDQNPL